MATAADKTVVAAFGNIDDAAAAVRELRQAGVPAEEISLVANERSDREPLPDDIVSDVAADAGIGAGLGAIGGLLLGLTALIIPGIGPVLAAGPLLAALGGAGVGAIAGGLVGALNEAGVPEDDAKHYAERVQQGDVLVTVRTSDSDADRVRSILCRNRS